ncbi:MAG: zf-HC2 domain-containing protein [Bryobacteraceae bacterium]|jgi:anti-sigma factor RsiW
MGATNCGWNEETLLEYGAGRLDSRTRASVERHLEVCAACREAAAGQQALWAALDAWEAPPVAADFDRRLYRRMEEDVPWRERMLRLFRPALVRRGLPIAAAAGLAVAAVILIERPAASPPVPAANAQQVEPLRPDQGESALQDMEMLQEFNGLIRPDAGESRL